MLRSPDACIQDTGDDLVKILRVLSQGGGQKCAYLAKAADEIERVRMLIDGRDKFIVDQGLWLEFVDEDKILGKPVADRPNHATSVEDLRALMALKEGDGEFITAPLDVIQQLGEPSENSPSPAEPKMQYFKGDDPFPEEWLAPGTYPTFALTDQHAAALERAIRAEGYEIQADPESGEVKLNRPGWDVPENPWPALERMRTALRDMLNIAHNKALTETMSGNALDNSWRTIESICREVLAEASQEAP